MTLKEIRALELPMAEDCHVWLWATNQFFPDALQIVKSWGLKYVPHIRLVQEPMVISLGKPPGQRGIRSICPSWVAGLVDTETFPPAFCAV